MIGNSFYVITITDVDDDNLVYNDTYSVKIYQASGVIIVDGKVTELTTSEGTYKFSPISITFPGEEEKRFAWIPDHLYANDFNKDNVTIELDEGLEELL